MRTPAVRTIVPGPIPGSKNPGPIADGPAAVAEAQETLVDAQIKLVGVTGTGYYGKQLMEAYLGAKRASGMLIAAAADPRTGNAAEYASAADLAKKSASMIGQAIKALKSQGEPSPELRDLTTKRLQAAHEVLGMATIGAFTGTHY